MSEWISVEEKLPENEDYVLAYAEKKDISAVSIFVNKKIIAKYLGVESELEYYFCSIENIGRIFHGITHWMPLPQPPNGENNAI